MKNVCSPFILCSLILAGCSSTGVLSKGGGNYTVSATNSLAGSTAAKKSVFEEAEAFCSKQGKNIEVISSQQGYEQWHLDFYCK